MRALALLQAVSTSDISFASSAYISEPRCLGLAATAACRCVVPRRLPRLLSLLPIRRLQLPGTVQLRCSLTRHSNLLKLYPPVRYKRFAARD